MLELYVVFETGCIFPKEKKCVEGLGGRGGRGGGATLSCYFKSKLYVIPLYTSPQHIIMTVNVLHYLHCIKLKNIIPCIPYTIHTIRCQVNIKLCPNLSLSRSDSYHPSLEFGTPYCTGLLYRVSYLLDLIKEWYTHLWTVLHCTVFSTRQHPAGLKGKTGLIGFWSLVNPSNAIT